MFKGQHKGLYALALANTGERFGYYTMLAIFLLFLQAKFGFSAAAAGQFYAIFLAAVYFMPVVGGWLADKIGFGKCVITGVCVMFAGYLCLAIPTNAFAGRGLALALMIGALLLIAIGTGLFKGNLQVLVGNLYDDPQYSAKRDSAFSLFYMAINIGAMFAPTAATALTNKHLATAGLIYKADIPALAHQYLGGADVAAQLESLKAAMPGANVASMNLTDFSQYYITHLSTAYNLGFAVACVSLIFSIAIYLGFRNWFKHADVNAKQAKAGAGAPVAELSPKQTRDRIVALIFVFAVVIFFWMAFHQNGSSLTYFARDYTQSTVSGPLRIGFSIWPLFLIAVSVYTLFGAFQSETSRAKITCGIATLALWAGAYAIYAGMDPTIHILPQQFQQFNPFFVVALTPVSMAIFSALASKGKEPSAPKKIGLGMFVAALGYLIMLAASKGQPAPSTLVSVGGVSPDPVVPTYLISTYLVLTFAELLLSPMGISFVSKVAPPKYKGLMMGLWFAATAIGNYLSS
ncbi:MAG: peptide MFS transporter, partial [Bacteroidales bacterium]|nr:peptide MFS transporter [Bacteroidales bacterium]